MPYVEFNVREWAKLRADTPLTLDEDDLVRLRGINNELSLDEVELVYLPVARLLSLYVDATAEFLGRPAKKVPYVIGIAGSVAVGKSTTARVLRELLSRSPQHPHVDLVTTDGFLFPTEELERRGLMERKGFPETYDLSALMRFIGAVKSGVRGVRSPVYSHLTYDIVADDVIEVNQPDIMIIEGLNVLQSGAIEGRIPSVFLSDFFDFSIFLDADPADIRAWYIDRFLALRDTAFRDTRSYFHKYASLSNADAERMANEIWARINEINLVENILPTRDRANLVLTKGADHGVKSVRLRKI